VPLLDGWEIDAFRDKGGGEIADCIRTMAALRLKIILFDASRRREVGREGAMNVSVAYLDEVSTAQRRAQTDTNDLIRAANLADLRNVSNTRSKLLWAAAELRSFVARVKNEFAAEASAEGGVGEAAQATESPDEISVVVPSVGQNIDTPFAAEGNDLGGFDEWRQKHTLKAPDKKRTLPAKKRSLQGPASRKVIMFTSSLLVLVSTVLYFILDEKIGSLYKNRVPDFAEFDATQFSAILPVQSATKMHDAADIVVRNEWPALSPIVKREKVGALFNALRPSGIAQLFVFDQSRRMVATCKSGKITVID
jgi:hypothetical protein